PCGARPRGRAPSRLPRDLHESSDHLAQHIGIDVGVPPGHKLPKSLSIASHPTPLLLASSITSRPIATFCVCSFLPKCSSTYANASGDADLPSETPTRSIVVPTNGVTYPSQLAPVPSLADR